MKKKEGKWNTGDLLRIEEFEKLRRELEKKLGEVERWWKKLDPKMKRGEFGKFLEFRENFIEDLERLLCLPMMLESVDQKDRGAKLMKAKAQETAMMFDDSYRKIGHWLKGLETVEAKPKLGDAEARRLFGAVGDLEYGLKYGRLAAKHSLDQGEEEIDSRKSVYGVVSLNSLRDLITTEFSFEIRIGGKIRKIKTEAEMTALMRDPKIEIRRAAGAGLLKKYQENIDKLFEIYQSVVKDWVFEAKIRKYPNPIGMRNFDNQISGGVVEKLVEAVAEKRSVFWRFFKIKARLLGQKKLNRDDLYAPVGKGELKIEVGEGIRLVLEALEKFSPRFSEFGKKIVGENHIDYYPSEAKISGAYCVSPGPKITPYILTNYLGKENDVLTLAHELGHGIHSLYSASHHPSSYKSGLPLAETASTLAETILFEALYRKLSDRNQKIKLLANKIGDAYATILRQIYFTKFEIEAHNKMKDGLTVDQLSKMWMAGLKEQFGNWVRVDSKYQFEWARISHLFHTPFYCYAYAFGELLSLSLYGRYKKEGREMVGKIEKILEAGGSEEPEVTLAKAGIKIGEKKFWLQGFEVIEGWVEELEKLLAATI